MNRALFLQLGYAFLPILVFIVVDELYGVVAGMVAAIVFSAVESFWIRWKHGRWDAFLLFDVGLITLLGGISLVSHNDVFFKLKPAFLQSVLLVVLGLSAWSKIPLMELMARRYMGSIEFGDYQRQQLRIMTGRLFWLIAVHTSLVVWTAFYSSRRVWAFASGGMFYILFGAFFLFQWLSNRQMLRRSPRVDVLNQEEQKIGEVPEFLLASQPGLFHRAAHMHLLDPELRIFLRRTEQGLDLPLVTHVFSGETVSEAIRREMLQNGFSLEGREPELLFKFISPHPADTELVYSFYLRLPVSAELPAELNGDFFSFQDIRSRAREINVSDRALREVNILERVTTEAARDQSQKSSPETVKKPKKLQVNRKKKRR